MTKNRILLIAVIGVLIGLVVAQAREISHLNQAYVDINKAIRAGGIR
jgi:hypothetical protein